MKNYTNIILKACLVYLLAMYLISYVSCSERKKPEPIMPEPVAVADAPDSSKSIAQYYEQVIQGREDMPLSKDQAIYAYILRFRETAQQEQEKYGIPAEVTLAQGILESRYGRSKLAGLHNNHFGVKCFSKKCKKGHCVNYSDDSHKDFFKCYESAWESFRDHSKFLQRDNYKSCHECGPDNWECWAKCLKKRGYATSPTYDQKLIKLIKKYDIKEFCN